MASDAHPLPTGPSMLDVRSRHRHSAGRWGLGGLACLAAGIALFVVSMAVPSLLDAVVYTYFALLPAFVVCTLMFLVRLVQSFVARPRPLRLPSVPTHPDWPGNLSAEMDRVMDRARANDRWVTRLQLLFAATAGIIFLSVVIPRFFGVAFWVAVSLMAAAAVGLVFLAIRNSQTAAAVDRFNRDAEKEYGSEISTELKRHSFGLHWWEWVAEVIGIIAVIMGGIVLTDVGMDQGWLPRSRPVAEGIMSSFAAVFVITAIMVWGIFRSPAFAGRRRAMLVVTALAAAASASVGLIGSVIHWRPFVSTISGRDAGIIQGAVFFCIWLAGYRLTKRASSSV
jgi:hypothetical protein